MLWFCWMGQCQLLSRALKSQLPMENWSLLADLDQVLMGNWVQPLQKFCKLSFPLIALASISSSTTLRCVNDSFISCFLLRLLFFFNSSFSWFVNKIVCHERWNKSFEIPLSLSLMPRRLYSFIYYLMDKRNNLCLRRLLTTNVSGDFVSFFQDY